MSNEAEWASVRLQYEHNPNKPGGSETIHIQAPHSRAPTGELIAGDGFGVVEQKIATSLGPMLGKGLIRLDAKVRKGMPNVRTSWRNMDYSSYRCSPASHFASTNAGIYP